MISKTIEDVIREFDYCAYDMHAMHDLEDEPEKVWPAALAEQIARAVALEIKAIVDSTLAVPEAPQ